MPLEISLRRTEDKQLLRRHILFPSWIAQIEDITDGGPVTVFFFCNPDDDGFTVTAEDQQQPFEADEDETYRFPFTDEIQGECVVIARHIGGHALIYSIDKRVDHLKTFTTELE
jgi:hypothetical protein